MRSILRLFLLMVLIWLPGQSAQAADEITPQQVRASIEKAAGFLKREQKQDGQWLDRGNIPGGVTALCTLALLSAGEPPDDPNVGRAITYLRGLKLEHTYSVSLQTMVFCAAEPTKDLQKILHNVKWLESTQVREGAFKGAWAYGGAGQGDPSNTQFALLALYEAARVGVPVQQQTWELSEAYWKKFQNPDGSWPYYPGRPGSGSMTCAGIASLVICSGRLSTGDAKVAGGQVQCCGKQDDNEHLDNALAWMGRNFTVETNPSSEGGFGGNHWLLYYLYGVERVGRMTARRFIGKHDWYREGADRLVRHQDKLSGFWKGTGPRESDAYIGTSLALLFMAKGRRPVLLAKIKHGPGEDWNRHRSDLANLTGYVETKWKRELSWQVYDIAGATVDDLLQAPVLFINGSQSPDLMSQAAKLREYVNRGGFIFAEACCPDSSGFDQGFRELMAAVFEDQPEYQLRKLPLSHPAWYAEEPVSPQHRPILWGIDYGCRTSVIYCPPPGPDDPPHNLSCLWELSQGRDQKFVPLVKAQIAAANSIGINVLAYATNREIRGKEESFAAVSEEGPSDSVERGKLYIAKLSHAGGCDAAPAALSNLLKAADRELKIRVGTEQRLIPITDKSLFKYHLVFMHGRHGFRLSGEERKALRAFLERDGTLLADAICANREFAEAFRREMKAIFPEHAIESIPAAHPIFSEALGGFDLSQVSRREPQTRAGAGPLKSAIRQTQPELEGIKLGDRYAVIFSKYDLSCALEKHDSLECEGYTREDAERIGLNVILYSLHQ